MKWKETAAPMENPPPGTHLARCYALIDLGTQPHAWQGITRLSRDVRISFELPYARMTGKYNPEAKGKPFSVHVTAKQSLHENSRLRKLLEGWRGKKFDAETLSKFDPKKLLGQPCRLVLVESENGQYVNVDSIGPVSREEAKTIPKPFNPLVYFSLEPDEFDEATFELLTERTKLRIMQSPEYQRLRNNEEHEESPPVEDEHVPDPFV